MSFKIAFKRSVLRDLRKICKDQAERISRKIEEDLFEKADSLPLLTGTFAGLRTLRVGNYRVIYTIIKDTLSPRILELRI